ncbi:MAG: cyclic nucleotide-binding protein [Firmicutes bacterium HGW-Firmicutes-10]|nr:DUF1003 domain-containing protein [Erysipelotrichaceae bacterium]PKM87422.1 MAG: cyclic nucleotide-binding protein [Firmicutes bacterium HGW-Firmicutes-10]
MAKKGKINPEILIKESEGKSINIIHDQQLTFGQKLSDTISEKVGSWGFIITFTIVIIVWISLNAYVLIKKPFDPYPFILLNLVLSCIAALQAPIIMMSQNRQEVKDSLRIENDYIVDQQSIVLLEELRTEINSLKVQQKKILELLQNNHEQMK